MKVAILGSTGSIGQQTLDVIRSNPEEVEVVGLAAGSWVEELLQQAAEFENAVVALGHEELSNTSKGATLELLGSRFLGFGEDAVLKIISESGADVIVNSLVGAQGVRASYLTLKLGIDLALANKESLVVAGDILMPMVVASDFGYVTKQNISKGNYLDSRFLPNGRLRPIDSEHGAIFQCLLGEDMWNVSKLWVTASGGPFRGKVASQLENVTAEDALAHPTWNMGPKITIDSSTLMNKGLEIIEAHHLFGMPYDKIEVVVQPQSAIHSMVEFKDGSVKAHLGTTDMRIPIQFALSYPNRWGAPVESIDFRTLGNLEFSSADEETFRCLALAREAGLTGGTMPCVMNAANEVAVAAFLDGRCAFLDIARVVEEVMQAHSARKAESIEQLLSIDTLSRTKAEEILKTLQS